MIYVAENILRGLVVLGILALIFAGPVYLINIYGAPAAAAFIILTVLIVAYKIGSETR